MMTENVFLGSLNPFRLFKPKACLTIDLTVIGKMAAINASANMLNHRIIITFLIHHPLFVLHEVYCRDYKATKFYSAWCKLS